MSLLIKVKKVTIENEELYCVVDMKTISTYKSLTGESFLKAVQKMADMDDEVMLMLLASSLRKTPDGDPVGLEYINKFNPIAFLFELMDTLTEVIEESLPKTTPGEVTAKKKGKK